MAKPYKFNASVREEFLKLLEEGYTKTTASAIVDVDRSTVYKYGERDGEFKIKMEIAKRKGSKIGEDKLREQVMEGNVNAIKFYLTNRLPDEFVNRKRQEVTGEGGGPVETKNENEVKFDSSQADEFIRAVQSNRERAGDGEESSE